MLKQLLSFITIISLLLSSSFPIYASEMKLDQISNIILEENSSDSLQDKIEEMDKLKINDIQHNNQVEKYIVYIEKPEFIELGFKPTLEEIITYFPTTLKATFNDGSVVELPIKWSCVGDYEKTNYYYYQFDAVLETNSYCFSNNIQWPYIGVSFITQNCFSVTGKSNETVIYNWLKNTMGCNTAVACGILANIERESGFSTTASCIDTNGKTSYGICQWNGSRFTALKNYCNEKGLDYSSLDGQLNYLKYELLNSEKNAWSRMQGIENSSSGAYQAGYNWARYFERCSSDYYTVSANRAQIKYWPEYSGDICNCSEVYAGNYICTTSSIDLRIRNGHGTSYSTIGSIPSGATVYVSKASGTGSNDWAHVEYNGVSGYASMEYLSKQQSVQAGIKHWLSDTAMGEEVSTFEQGKYYYLCYEIKDANSGKLLSEVGNYSYSVKQMLLYPDGTVGTECTYNNDNNWIAIKCTVPGTYSYKIEITGDWNGTISKTFEVEANPLTMKPSSSSVDLSIGGTESQVVNIQTGGYYNGRSHLNFRCSNSNVSCSWGEWTGTGWPLTISAKNEGSTDVTVSIVDSDTGKVLLSTVINVTVSNNSYTISYNANGGTGAPSIQTKIHGTNLTLSSTKPTRDGYTFLGWNTSANATTAEYQAGGNYTLNESVKLYAVWQSNMSITAQPTNVTVTEGQPASFTVKASGSNLKYQWQYYDAESSAWKNLEANGSTTETLQISGMDTKNGQKYRCIITDGMGNKATSSSATLTVTSDKPSAVSGLKIGGRAADALRLNWNKNSNASGYIIEQYKDGKWTRITRIGSNSTITYRVEKLSASTTYKFRVQSFNLSGNTANYSNWQYINGKTLPTTISGLKIGGRATDALRLNWSKNSSASGYIIEQYKDGKWTRIAKIENNSTTTYRVEKLSASTTYKFRVQSYNFDGSTPLYSSWKNIEGTTLPTTVSGLKIGGRATDALRLNWNKNEKASGYIIEQYKNGKWTRIARIGSNSTTTYRVEGLSASASYKFRVQSFGFDGNTAIYSSWKSIDGKTLPTTVSGLRIGGQATDALRLNWDKNSNASGYIIEQYKNGKWTRIARIGSNSTTTYRVEKLSTSTTYKFRVQSFGFDGDTAIYSGWQYVNGTTK